MESLESSNAHIVHNSSSIYALRRLLNHYYIFKSVQKGLETRSNSGVVVVVMVVVIVIVCVQMHVQEECMQRQMCNI